MTRETNFNRYLQEQLRDPEFAERFKRAGEAWDVAMQLTALRKSHGLSQQELAKRVGTSQQQISRLESPSYEGHSLSMLRKAAGVLGASVQVKILNNKAPKSSAVAEKQEPYGRKSKRKGGVKHKKKAGK